MGALLRVLIVEDSEDDAALLVRELSTEYQPQYERVDTAEGMSEALGRQEWDIVLADYSMPHFSGPGALELLQESGLDLPFILVSGVVGEEAAVAAMRAGAHDYLLKDNLARLVPAVARELKEAEVRRARAQAEEELRASEERFRRLYTATPAMLQSIDPESSLLNVSDRWLEVLGYERGEVIGRGVVEFLTEESRRYVEEVALPDFWKQGAARDIRLQFVRKDGEIVDILLSAIAEYDKEGNPYRTLAVLMDITEQKRLEEQLQCAREELEGKVERQMLRKNPYGLTFRELTVLHLVAVGRSDKEIATELVISPQTVHKHVSNILSKMDAASRTEAATRALKEGLLE